MPTKYSLIYDFTWEAEVEIDEENPKAQAAIKEMVEFWSGWKSDLRAAHGNYTKLFLINLTKTLLPISLEGWNTEGVIEELAKKEGWYRLDGSEGITLTYCENFEFDTRQMSIKKQG